MSKRMFGSKPENINNKEIHRLPPKNNCNLVGLEEYNTGRISTLFSILVLFD